ncbi:MAG: reverse transcriptase domain-containing protein [Thermodesulfovibrionales bacterium]
MPELPFCNSTSLPLMGGVVGSGWQVCIVIPLCAHPARRALADSQAYRRGLPDEGLISGWANVQSNNYWSSTTYANNTDNAWIVNMWNGNVNANNKTNNNYVWPVRAGEWLPSLFSFENLYLSYLKCRKNKRNTINALKFEIKAEDNLFKLSEELMRRTYQPSRSVCFIVERPKMREIIAADFRDRVVHHLLIERLEAIYEPLFIYDSYACRKDKGLHRAIERVKEFIRKGSGNSRRKLYFIHLDIKNFFMSIDKNILYTLLKKKVKDENLLWLARVIIFHNPVENCIIKGKGYLIKSLPPHKSLFHAPEDRGLPVGNLTSQFFANVYLNELDQFVKHTLKCRYYIRYCDDFLILNESPDRLKEIKEKIKDFVTERLNLSLNERYQSVMPVSNGIDFLGYIIRQDYILVRQRVINNLRSKLNWFEKRLITENEGYKIIRYDYKLIERLRSVLASYLGHIKWADAYRLKWAVLKRYDFLKEYISFDDGRVRLLHRYCEIFPSLRSQYLYYACLFREMAVFFQVGGFYEFYGMPWREDALAILKLKKLKKNKRGAIYGFPVGLERRYTERLVNKGIPVVIIKETDRYIGRIKERLPIMKLIKKEA